MHCNVKPSKGAIFETGEQALCHMFLMGWHVQSHWQDWHFGRDLALIRKAEQAIKARNYSAFKASPRRGYWKIELVEGI